MEFIEVLSGQRLEAVEDHVLLHGLKRVIASQAAMEGLDFIYQFKTLNDFFRLLERVKRAQAITMRNDFSHQQAAVACQQDAFLPVCDFRHIRIVIIILIQAVKSQHAQMRGQAPKVAVEQKSRLDETAIFDGIYFDLISIQCDPPQRLIPTVDLYPSDLRVRRSQRLRQMLDGLPLLKMDRDLTVSLISRLEILQPAVK